MPPAGVSISRTFSFRSHPTDVATMSAAAQNSPAEENWIEREPKCLELTMIDFIFVLGHFVLVHKVN